MRCVGLAICGIWYMKVLCLSRILAVRIRSFGPASLHAVAYASHQFQSWRTVRRGYASIARHTRNASSLLATRLLLHVLTAWQCGTCVVLTCFHSAKCLLLQADLLRGVAISGLSALPTSPSVLGGAPLGDSPLAQAFAVSDVACFCQCSLSWLISTQQRTIFAYLASLPQGSSCIFLARSACYLLPAASQSDYLAFSDCLCLSCASS
jgi:hypothetical protein